MAAVKWAKLVEKTGSALEFERIHTLSLTHTYSLLSPERQNTGAGGKRTHDSRGIRQELQHSGK